VSQGVCGIAPEPRSALGAPPRTDGRHVTR